ncbi:phospholipase D [Clavulina sp. PMI_390]|nr:phospholipase D [Clavulina sp. PMI_390]
MGPQPPSTDSKTLRSPHPLVPRISNLQAHPLTLEHPDSPKTPSSPQGDEWKPGSPSSRLASRRWSLIKDRLVPGSKQPRPGDSAAAVPSDVNITDELLGGGLATLMVKLHFDRDEQGKRRMPVLLHHLKIRVSDSINPLHGTHTAFRIECEYANGAARWVIYRQLRDFVTLHTHYRVAKVYGRSDLDIPEFPLTSLPYFKFFNSQELNTTNDERKQAFARLQRAHLETYLLALIRCVMFRPEANRLCKFLEISALSISLAKKGGQGSIQGKSGYLRVIGNQTSRRSFGRGLSFAKLGEVSKPRWWIVRESYMAAVNDPGETELFDVFLFDRDFIIKRPKRYYRKLDPSRLWDDGEDMPETESLQGREATTHSPNSHTLLSSLMERLHFAKNSHQQSTLDPSRNLVSSINNGGDPSNLPLHPQMIGNTTSLSMQDGKPTKGPLDVSQHTFRIQNSQRKLKLVASNERQLHQWLLSVERMALASDWTTPHRFESFAPIRLNVAAQWLVDGRDYFWNLSRAISMAKHTIYIHDWWLSPELHLRRPGKNQYRIDKLLKRKAEEGVRIFVIIYREVSSRTTPTDSNYAKQRLVALHPNIMVQRSPDHITTGTFFWAHHEKLCVVDHSIAFIGGLDMCFGRWDTPQHVLVDDPDDERERLWLGKDYSNERAADYVDLNKPFEDLHDRTKVPRMPWHDVAVQLLGQPARDLSRHFVQRWNYLLRIKTHSRRMPFLLPPPDFSGPDLEAEQMTGSCEVQICRSAGNWSMGLQGNVEHSIQNAYLKAIQLSEFFVYIENQFFITSTTVNDVKIENKIGDALVSRIIRAHQEGTSWRAIIVIPLVPGFAFPIDHGDASAIRIIMECQNRTICRGPHSIFARLRKEGIEPNEYIAFYGLRQWGKLRGGDLTTEQIYIHAKAMVVDDRLAIIGSANINERSQRGDRDSELACVVRDTDMIDSTLGGKDVKVGRFAHTLRLRLMREHLGIDIDKVYTQVPPTSGRSAMDDEASRMQYADLSSMATPTTSRLHLNHPTQMDDTPVAADSRPDNPSPSIPADHRAVPSSPNLAPPSVPDNSTSKPWVAPTARPRVTEQDFIDPVSDAFFKGIWNAAAVHNTEIYRKVFSCVPDDLVTTWKQYKECAQLQARAAQSAGTPKVGRSQTPSDHLTHSESDTKSISVNGRATEPRVDDKAAGPVVPTNMDNMEAILDDLCGHLVTYPTRFLEAEDISNNFLFNTDRLLPMPIYN